MLKGTWSDYFSLLMLSGEHFSGLVNVFPEKGTPVNVDTAGYAALVGGCIRTVSRHRLPVGRKGSKITLPPFCATPMLVKLTSKNQFTLPKAVTGDFRGVEYFDVSIANGCIVLAPVEMQRGGAVRAKLADLNVAETDIREAVEWARGRGP